MNREAYIVKGPSNTFMTENSLSGGYCFTDEELDAKLFDTYSEVGDAIETYEEYGGCIDTEDMTIQKIKISYTVVDESKIYRP